MGSTHRHCWTFLFPWLVCLVAGISSSCAPLGGQKENEKGLLLAVDRFSKDIRWEDYKSASSWIAPEAKDQFWDQADRLHEGVRIVDYQVVDVLLDGISGKVTLRYRFYQKQNPQIQTRTLHQQWLFSDKNGVWQVVRNDFQRLMPNFNFE
jgi:hypothetical protein